MAALLRLDILGRMLTVSPALVGRLRARAAARAGQSSSQRDLSLVLERALRTGATVALQRGEARALLELVETEPADAELAGIAEVVRAAL
jgi:hypothetical protein